ncbi:MAG: universal stress protein [Pseudomonadota bacterium]
MAEIKKILVPVDFSVNTEKLIEFAVFFAKKFDASLQLLNVVENPAAYEGFVSIQFEEDLKAGMEKKMIALVDESKGRCSGCQGDVLIGDTVDAIVTAAGKCDMIIIGTHGYRGFEKIVMGSVAERVVKNAPCPVLVFNPYK